MKRAITSVAAVAILTVAGVSSAHALGFGDVSPNFSRQSTTTQRSGQDSISQGKNSGGRDRWEIKNGGDYKNDASTRFSSDSRKWDHSNRSTNTDSRDYSNQSTNTDSRDLSNKSINTDSRNQDASNRSINTDSRDLSDRSYRDHSDRSVNTTTNNQRYGSREAGGALFEKEVKVSAGHGSVNFGPISGGNGNVMDASINGNTFGIGNSGK